MLKYKIQIKIICIKCNWRNECFVCCLLRSLIQRGWRCGVCSVHCANRVIKVQYVIYIVCDFVVTHPSHSTSLKMATKVGRNM